MLLLWSVGAAWAGITLCTERYGPRTLDVDVGRTQDALLDGDLEEAEARLERMIERLPCLTEVVGRPPFARFARLWAFTHQLRDRPAEARRWARASRLADPELGWSYRFPSSHPLRQLVESVDLPAPEAPDRSVLAPPEGGGVFASGALLAAPALPPDVPVLVQVFDEQQAPVDAWWQSSAPLPRAVRREGGDPPSAPLWWKGSGPRSAEYRPSGWEERPMSPLGPASP